MTRGSALLVDDDPAVLLFAERCLQGMGLDVLGASSTGEARVALAAYEVDLLVTDIGLPGETGLELLRGLPLDGGPAALVLTGIEDEDMARSALDLGAYGYLTKPLSPSDLRVAVLGALRRRELEKEYRRTITRLEHLVDGHEETARARTLALHEAALLTQEEAVHALARAIESRDIVTGAHVDRMSFYCMLICDELGVSAAERREIGLAARLHDVGKVAVPDRILLKPGPLDADELWVMQSHCQVGYEILSRSTSSVLKLAAEIALTHHEWFDGRGYPRGLRGDNVPLSGRIAAIADVFDALTSERPYRGEMRFDVAVELMRSERGTHFDPTLLDHFVGSPRLRSVMLSVVPIGGGTSG